jgi:hypothetical protein
MRVFIDANIYLVYLEKSNEKLDLLSELKRLIKEKKIELIFPLITQEEFFRRYPSVCIRYFKALNNTKPSGPPIVASVARKRKVKIKSKLEKLYLEYLKELEIVKVAHKKSVDKFIKKDIEGLIKLSVVAKYDEHLFNLAYRRKLLGNPPGKRINPVGDELVWEMILADFTDDDLCIVSGDGDWGNELERDNQVNPLLSKEWKNKTNKNLMLFSALGDFINFITKKETVPKAQIDEEKRATQNIQKIGMALATTYSHDVPSMASASLGWNYVENDIPDYASLVAAPLNSLENSIFSERSPWLLSTGGALFSAKCSICNKDLEHPWQSICGICAATQNGWLRTAK